MQDADSAVTDRMNRIESRVQTLEEFRHATEVAAGRQEEQQKAIVKSIDTVAGQVSTIKGDVSKVLWIVVGVIVAAAVKWVIDGGFSSA